MSTIDNDLLQAAFAPLIGLPAWNVDKGQGSILTFQFGDPHLWIREPVTQIRSESERVRRRLSRRVVKPVGVWELFVFDCYWRVTVDGTQKAWSDSSDGEIIEAVRELNGQKLMAVEADAVGVTSAFRFDLGASLETWPPDYQADEDQWSLYAPGKQVFSFLRDGSFSWEAANKPCSVLE